jgi:hypothetical protein
MSTRRYINLILLCVLISSSAHSVKEDRYTRNVREDRCAHITIIVGAFFTLALIPGAVILSPRGSFNMQPSCPQSSPIQCCDPKAPGQNVTTAPNNCAPLPSGSINCAEPKVAYCFGATVPADFELQQWAKGVGGSLVGIGAAGFVTFVAGVITGFCQGTFCF